jgi:hypothetical protein
LLDAFKKLLTFTMNIDEYQILVWPTLGVSHLIFGEYQTAPHPSVGSTLGKSGVSDQCHYGRRIVFVAHIVPRPMKILESRGLENGCVQV